MAFERPPIDSDDVSDDDEGIEGLQPSKVSPSRYLSPVFTSAPPSDRRGHYATRAHWSSMPAGCVTHEFMRIINRIGIEWTRIGPHVI